MFITISGERTDWLLMEMVGGMVGWWKHGWCIQSQGVPLCLQLERLLLQRPTLLVPESAPQPQSYNVEVYCGPESVRHSASVNLNSHGTKELPRKRSNLRNVKIYTTRALSCKR